MTSGGRLASSLLYVFWERGPVLLQMTDKYCPPSSTWSTCLAQASMRGGGWHFVHGTGGSRLTLEWPSTIGGAPPWTPFPQANVYLPGVAEKGGRVLAPDPSHGTATRCTQREHSEALN